MASSLGKSMAWLLLKMNFFRVIIFKLYSPAIRLEYKKLNRIEFSEFIELLRVQPSPYGLIRKGSNFDGGYVIANSLHKDDFLLSFGVGTDVSFEHSLSNSIKGIHLYDHTVYELPTEISNATFFKKGLSVKPEKNMTDLKTALCEIPNASDLILKLDIEGDEWKILDETRPELLEKFKQIVIEFHHLESISSELNFQLFSRVLKKLNQTHNVINVHGNNWDSFKVIYGQMWANALEVSYLRKDFFSDRKSSKLPDVNLPNNPERPDYNLGF